MKKDYLKKIVSLGLIVSMAAVLGGCGASGSSGGSTGTAGEREYTFTFAEHVANVKEQAPQVYAVVKAYEDAHPNVKIDLQGTSSDEQIRNIKMAAQNDTLPELFWMEQGGAVELAENGYLADITEDITSDQEFVDGFCRICWIR